MKLTSNWPTTVNICHLKQSCLCLHCGKSTGHTLKQIISNNSQHAMIHNQSRSTFSHMLSINEKRRKSKAYHSKIHQHLPNPTTSLQNKVNQQRESRLNIFQGYIFNFKESLQRMPPMKLLAKQLTEIHLRIYVNRCASTELSLGSAFLQSLFNHQKYMIFWNKYQRYVMIFGHNTATDNTYRYWKFYCACFLPNSWWSLYSTMNGISSVKTLRQNQQERF